MDAPGARGRGRRDGGRRAAEAGNEAAGAGRGMVGMSMTDGPQRPVGELADPTAQETVCTAPKWILLRQSKLGTELDDFF